MAPKAPVNIPHRDAPSEDIERIPVFTVQRPNPEYERWLGQEHGEGEVSPAVTVDTVYSMPAKPNPGTALEYLRQARQNSDLAAAWLIEQQIGSDGYDALVAELSMLSADEASDLLAAVSDRIRDVTMGGLEAPKG